ncbi:nucleotide exchange factor GrpE [Candidatus Parcubacteria bacterium]|nr:MAG: nucleotide exchange factor GrpE [Candidatus Parcubacteria bacterium]
MVTKDAENKQDKTQQGDLPKQDRPSEKVEELKKRINDLENQLKRAVADYRNLEKRVGEEKRETIKFANKELLLRIFPALDTLFLAGKYVKDEGLKLTIKKVNDVLKEVGVERVETESKEFNPELMECVEIVEGEEDMVIEEVLPGFTLQGKLLRPAQVKVGKSNEDKNLKTEEELVD